MYKVLEIKPNYKIYKKTKFNTNDHKKNLMWKEFDCVKQIRKYNVKQSKNNSIN